MSSFTCVHARRRLPSSRAMASLRPGPSPPSISNIFPRVSKLAELSFHFQANPKLTPIYAPKALTVNRQELWSTSLRG